MAGRGTSQRGGVYDVVVVGSGFGGSVAALRLSEKGYRVAVVEAGQRFDATNLPRSSWDLRRFLWAPALGCYGIQRAHFLPHLVVLAGAGVGGGSLNYGNTLYRPPSSFFADPQWPRLPGGRGWEEELGPFYDQASRMLGVVDEAPRSPADDAMRAVAEEMGAGTTFRQAPVGVVFGPPGTSPGASVPDPFFGGAGPVRRACLQCGECMTGCRHGAKNTLVTNYLFLAERSGAKVFPMTTVTRLAPLVDGGWEVGARPTGPWLRSRGRETVFRAAHVVLAAGAWGTQELLARQVLEGRLPRLSPRLGHLARTNAESLLGAVVPRAGAAPDFSRGVAITSSFWPAPGTHVEPVRYGHGSNAMALFGALLVDRPGPPARDGLRQLWRAVRRQPSQLLRLADLRGWSERAIIALVMQARPGSLVLSARRGLTGRARLTSRQAADDPNPAWAPLGHEVVERLARVIGGFPEGTWGEILGVPMTAHFLGGCTLGASAETGVVDPFHRVYGYEGLHVVDGSVVPANLGVNPSLTITAMAERAMAYWPNKGEQDGRGEGVPRPVAPLHPLVPSGAPGELRLSSA
jgi:cholesterol oxidase